MYTRNQLVAVRGVLIVPVHGTWVIRLARLVAAKWARRHDIQITHASVKPAMDPSSGMLGYEVFVTVPAGTRVSNYDAMPHSDPIANA